MGSGINMVVEDANDVRLAIGCDGGDFHSPGRWQAGMQRLRILERTGWVFWRCSASTWALRKHEVLDELVERMRRMGIEPLGAMERTASLVEHRKWPQREPAQEKDTAIPADAETGVPRWRKAAMAAKVAICNPDNTEWEEDMGVINIPPNEQDALRRTDTEALHALIEQCLRDERPFALRELPLHGCGLFVATKRHAFERALDAYSKAKSVKKRADTLYDARSAGDTLLYAVQEMQHRMATEAEEGERFYIEDLITPPYSLSTHLSVRVSYRWRPSPAEAWVSGSITFLYDVDLRTDYTRPPPQTERREACRIWEAIRSTTHAKHRDSIGNPSCDPVRHKRGPDAGSCVEPKSCRMPPVFGPTLCRPAM